MRPFFKRRPRRPRRPAFTFRAAPALRPCAPSSPATMSFFVLLQRPPSASASSGRRRRPPQPPSAASDVLQRPSSASASVVLRPPPPAASVLVRPPASASRRPRPPSASSSVLLQRPPPPAASVLLLRPPATSFSVLLLRPPSASSSFGLLLQRPPPPASSVLLLQRPPPSASVLLPSSVLLRPPSASFGLLLLRPLPPASSSSVLLRPPASSLANSSSDAFRCGRRSDIRTAAGHAGCMPPCAGRRAATHGCMERKGEERRREGPRADRWGAGAAPWMRSEAAAACMSTQRFTRAGDVSGWMPTAARCCPRATHGTAHSTTHSTAAARRGIARMCMCGEGGGVRLTPRATRLTCPSSMTCPPFMYDVTLMPLAPCHVACPSAKCPRTQCPLSIDAPGNSSAMRHRLQGSSLDQAGTPSPAGLQRPARPLVARVRAAEMLKRDAAAAREHC